MLENTFCHLAGVSPRAEALLWSEGIHSWDEFIATEELHLTPARTAAIRAGLADSRQFLALRDPLYFARKLPSRELWRLFPAFRHSVAYLDIETTGLGRPSDHITTIALYDGANVRHYVHGDNLREFATDIARYRLLVTYNGKCFDIPFIEREFGISVPQAHIDLMYLLRSLGIKGGLKGCERQLGIGRDELEGVDGYFAVLLWRDYLDRGNPGALATLLAYNIADAVNLETLLVMAYNMKLQATPFAATHRLPLPKPPLAPFVADPKTIQRLKRNVSWV